jgi:cysteine synthase
MSGPISTPHVSVPNAAAIMGYASDLHVVMKDESRQLGRSIKGRVACAMASRSRESGKPIVESSSGNLALGLGLWCRQLGAPEPLCLVDDCCERSMIGALAAAGCLIEVLALTGQEREEQSGVIKRVAKAREYSAKGYYWPNQYDCHDWIRVHQLTTGPEIWSDRSRYDLVVGAVGTGATISGVALSRPAGVATRVVAVEPTGSAIFGGPRGPYKIAGAGNPFTPGNYLPEQVDLELDVGDDESFHAARALRAAGLRIGSSGAMALVGAIRAAERLGGGRQTALVIVADDGWYEDI